MSDSHRTNDLRLTDFVAWAESLGDTRIEQGRCPLQRWLNAHAVGHEEWIPTPTSRLVPLPEWAKSFIRYADGFGWSSHDYTVEAFRSALDTVKHAYVGLLGPGYAFATFRAATLSALEKNDGG